MKMPGQSLAGPDLLSASSPGSKKPGGSNNQSVEIFSDSYELRTNLGVFRKDVQATERLGKQTLSRLNCDLLTLTLAGSNELRTLVAETNVVIVRQDTNRFTAGKAVYSATNGVLNLMDNPFWQSGLREGKGDLLQLNSHSSEMLARGNAWMRLPADEFAGQLGPAASGQKPKPPPTTGRSVFAEIFSSEYTLGTNSASFRGEVHACHPQMEWFCKTLVLKSPAQMHGKADGIVAEEGVEFDLQNEDGQKVHGTGDKAVYTFSISDSVTNDLLTLTGDPATLVTTNGTVRNDRIIYNHATGQLSAPGGKYRIEGAAPGLGSNAFILPKAKIGRP
jgi:lipopolysaccharide export system protein LptA